MNETIGRRRVFSNKDTSRAPVVALPTIGAPSHGTCDAVEPPPDPGAPRRPVHRRRIVCAVAVAMFATTVRADAPKLLPKDASPTRTVSNEAPAPRELPLTGQRSRRLSPLRGQEGHREAPSGTPLSLQQLQQRQTAAPAAVARGPFTSVQVNVDANGNNTIGDASNEPSIAVDPGNPSLMCIGWRHFDTITNDFRQAGIGYSSDGGQTWTFPDVLDRGQFRSDPVLGSDANGIFYYSSLSALDSIEVFRSFDGGQTWGVPVPAFGGDKQWIAIDQTPGIGAGNLYQIWNVQFSCCGNNDFTRTTDQAVSFDGPFVGPLSSMKWGTMDVGADGTLYLGGVTLDGLSHLFSFSTNAQDPSATPTFSTAQPVNLGGTVGFGAPPNPAGLLGQVGMHVDRSDGVTHGNLYMLQSVDPPGSDPLDVMIIRSGDGGASWSAPVRVNDDDPNTNAWQWLGTLSVAPNGRLDVVWNDTRASGQAHLSEVFYAFSMDAGRTWSKNVPLTPQFDSTIGWPVQQKMGDYYEMISDADGANLAYAATFNGEQDVWFLRIPADCNHNGFDDTDDINQARSSDCDGNGIPDECQLDCNGNQQADRCDITSGFSEDCNQDGIPDSCNTQFDCSAITIEPVTNACLFASVDLPGVNDSGDATVASVSAQYANGALHVALDISPLPDGQHQLCISAQENLSQQPDTIVFEALNSSCGPGGLYEFFLNGTSLGVVDADPTDGCTCSAAVQSIPVNDAGLLSAWNVGGSNTLRFVMTGGSENLAWIRARIRQGLIDETVCLFDTGSACTSGGLCDHSFVPSPQDVSVPAEFATSVACEVFTKAGETVLAINQPCQPQDCNANGVDDVQDIANLTSPDCNNNGVPDECEIDPNGAAPGGPFFCDPLSPPFGLSTCDPDCNDTGVPDECELAANDCNTNGIPDECDADQNGDGIPDDCQCFLSSQPVSMLVDTGSGIGNRTLVLETAAVDAGRTQAIRVTFTDLAAPYDIWNGAELWVQAPSARCEHSGTAFPPCPGGASNEFRAAALGCSPHYMDWSTEGPVHVYHEGIIPRSLYTVDVIDAGPLCDITDNTQYSPPLAVTTSKYGDVCSFFSGVDWPPPDGGVDVIADTVAVLAKFSNLPTAPILSRADLEPRDIDWKINITDAIHTLNGFMGTPYPYAPTVGDPCP